MLRTIARRLGDFPAYGVVEGVQHHAFARIQVERKDVLRIEAEFDGVKVGKRPNEEDGTEHEQK